MEVSQQGQPVPDSQAVQPVPVHDQAVSGLTIPCFWVKKGLFFDSNKPKPVKGLFVQPTLGEPYQFSLIFSFTPGLKLRSITKDGEPWFIARDVCAALNIQNTTQALLDVDAEDKSILNLGLPGKPPAIVNEAGMYAVVLKSRKPEAKAFKKWVTGTVLPSIRKNGGYLTPEVAVLRLQPKKFPVSALKTPSNLIAMKACQ